MRRMRASIGLAMCLCAFAAAHAQPAPGGGPWGGYGMGSMGPGMMGGYGMGMGPGMMEGYGPGYWGWGPNIPDLSADQRNKIAAIQKELRQKQWTLMEKMHDDAQQGGVYRNGKFDEQAARKAYDARQALHRQMFENSLDAQKRIDAILTPQQREQLQRAWGGR